MTAGSALRWTAAVSALVLVSYLAVNTAYSKSDELLDASTDSGSFNSNIAMLAWHPGNKVLKHKAKAAIPGLAPWAKALLDTAAKEQIQEVDRHAKSVKKQEELLAKEKKEQALARERQQNLAKTRMQTEIRMLQKRAKISLKVKAVEASKAKAKSHLQAKKAAEAKVPPKLQAINQKKESRFAAYGEVKSFFRDEETSLESKKKAAIQRVEEEAAAGIAKIKRDEKSDLHKIKVDSQNRLTSLYKEEANEEAFLQTKGMAAVARLVAHRSGLAAAAGGAPGVPAESPRRALADAERAAAIVKQVQEEQADRKRKEQKLEAEKKWWTDHGARGQTHESQEGLLHRLAARHAELASRRP